MICLILNIIIFWKQFYGCNFNWSINYFLKNTCMIKNITDMWTQPHWAGVTHISRLSPAWKFKLLFTRITDVSPAFCNCQVKQYPPPPPPPKKKTKTKTRKNKNKALFKEIKNLGKPFVSTKPWTFDNTMYEVSLLSLFFFVSLSSLL